MNVGFLGILAIVFIALKIIDAITLSWLWVLAPLWVPIAALIVMVPSMWLFSIVAVKINNTKNSRR